MSHSFLLCWALAASALYATSAHGEVEGRGASGSTQDHWDGDYGQRALQRSGFTASVGFGLGVSAASGYPNEPGKIDDPEFESSLGPGLGQVNTLWIGGALRDWFVLGFGLWSVRASEGDLEALGSGFLFRVEPFPLWSLGGRFRDLSLYANVGAGSHFISGGREKTNGGLMSMLSLGTSFELLRFGHFAFGPTLEGMLLYSLSAQATGGFLGLKSTLYGGP